MENNNKIESSTTMKTGRIGRRLKALLGAAAFLTAALACSVSLTDQGTVEAGTSGEYVPE